MRKALVIFLFTTMIFLLSGVPLPALNTLELDGGLLFIGSTDEQSAPSPLIPAIGMSFRIPSKLWIFDVESSFLLTGTYYQYENGRASPAEPEHRDFAVTGILGDARLAYGFPVGKKITLGGDFGLALFLRLPIPLFPDASQDFGPTFGYLHGRLRFLYPETGLFARLTVLENLDLKLSLRAGWPVYLIWDGEQLPFPEGLLVSGLIGLIWHRPQT